MSGGGGGGNSTSTQVNYSPEEAAQRAQVMNEATRIYGRTAPTISASAYPGAAPVPFSQATTTAQNLAVQNAAAAQDSINQINQGVNYGLNGAMDVQNNPYLQKAIDAAVRPINEQYTDAGGVMSTIRTNASNAGQYGGSRQGIAEGIAAGRHADAVGDVSSKIASEAYNKGQDTFAKTLMFAPQALEAGMTPVNWLSGVGAQQENLAQETENYNANARMWGLNAPWTPLQNYASIVYGGASPGTTTSTQYQSPSRSALGQAAGGAMTAAGLYQMMQGAA